MAEVSVAISNLEFRYGEGDFALRIPELQVARGEALAFVGPSGSGKTTLLHLIAGIVAPVEGRIVTEGVEVSALSEPARRDFRVGAIGLVFQEFELLHFLASHPGRVFRRTTLLKRVWGVDGYHGTRTVDVHVVRLREKLSGHDWIQTVRGVGYRFEA